MKYSIFVPTYNSGHWIKRCINSILSQSYIDFELLIMDSGSTDDTLEWIQSINDKRIIIFNTENRLTIEENWGRIVSVKKNEYMTIVGHDDILKPDFLQVIDQLISKYPDATLYHTHFDFIDSDDKLVRQCKPMNEKFDGDDFLQAFLCSSIDSMGTGYVIRSKDYDALGGIPTNYPNLLFADFALWNSLISRNYMAVAKENCFSFRVHNTSTTKTSPDFKLHIALELFVNYLIDFSREKKSYSSIINEFSAEFLLYYSAGYTNRLCRTPKEKRNGTSVNSFVDKTIKMSEILGVSNKYNPKKNKKILLALIIDSNIILRNMFLMFIKIHPKPILK